MSDFSGSSDASIAVLQVQVAQLQHEVKELTEATKALVDAWQAARTFMTMVKVMSSLVTGAGVLWYAFTHFTFPHS